MRRSYWLGMAVTLSLAAFMGYLAHSGAEEPTPAKPASEAAKSAAAPAAPCCQGNTKTAVPKEATSRTCPLYCFAEIQDGENTAHYYYAIEYEYDPTASPACTMQGMGMLILEEDPAPAWNNCNECEGGVRDGRKIEFKKAKLRKKLNDPQHLKAKRHGTVDLAQEKGSFYVRVPLPNLADAKVLVKVFYVNPTDANEEWSYRPRVMAVGVEAKGTGVDITTLPVAEEVDYSHAGQRVKFTVDGIPVEALLIPK